MHTGRSEMAVANFIAPARSAHNFRLRAAQLSQAAPSQHTKALVANSSSRPQGGLRVQSSSSSSTRLQLAQASQPTRCMSSAYDNPAIYSNDDAFSERLYWDKRYQQDPTTFEWYRSYDSLRPILTEHLPKEQQILQLGVGTSRIQEDMADDGYSHITSIDYSPVAIQRLQQAYPARPQLQYAVADGGAMPQYADGSFGGVLDKGTLDALLCGDDDTRASAELLGEVWRLLAPGGAYVMVTSASPKSRLQYLQTPAMPWQRLVVYEVGQQGAMSGPFLCSSSSRSSGAGGQQQQQQEQLALEQVLQLPLMGYSHIVYVCNKPC